MADDGVDSGAELKLFLIVLFGLGFLWYFSGGYERYKASRANEASSTVATTTIETANGTTSVEEKTYIIH